MFGGWEKWGAICGYLWVGVDRRVRDDYTRENEEVEIIHHSQTNFINRLFTHIMVQISEIGVNSRLLVIICEAAKIDEFPQFPSMQFIQNTIKSREICPKISSRSDTSRNRASHGVTNSVGHKGSYGHEFMEFEFLSDGTLRYANNSNYKNDVMIRKEGICPPWFP